MCVCVCVCVCVCMCVCVYVVVKKNIVVFYVEFRKKIILFSLFNSQFFIQEFISIAQLFLRGEWDNSLKRTYVERGAGVTCKTNRDEQGGRGPKIRRFERMMYFLNDPKVFSLQLRSMIC